MELQFPIDASAAGLAALGPGDFEAWTPGLWRSRLLRISDMRWRRDEGGIALELRGTVNRVFWLAAVLVAVGVFTGIVIASRGLPQGNQVRVILPIGAAVAIPIALGAPFLIAVNVARCNRAIGAILSLNPRSGALGIHGVQDSILLRDIDSVEVMHVHCLRKTSAMVDGQQMLLWQAGLRAKGTAGGGYCLMFFVHAGLRGYIGPRGECGIAERIGAELGRPVRLLEGTLKYEISR